MKPKNLIILAAVLVLIVGIYAVVKNLPKEDSQTPDSSIKLTDYTEEDIQQVVLKSREETLKLLKKDGKWDLDIPQKLNLQQYRLDNLAYNISTLTATKMLEDDVEDLSPFGLDTPAVTAEVKLSDGSTRVYYLGSKVPTSTSYYLMVEGDPRVYIVAEKYGTHLSYKLVDLRNEVAIPTVDNEKIVYLKIVQKDKPTLEIVQVKDEDMDQSRYTGSNLEIVEPYHYPVGVNVDQFPLLAEQIQGFQIKEFVEDDAEDLDKYGLEEPLKELKVRDESGSTLHLYFGKDKDDESSYFRIAGSDSVYTMDKAKLEFMNTDIFSLTDQFIYIVHIDNVEKMEFELDGKTHILSIQRNADGSAIYRVNGREVKGDSFTGFYGDLMFLLADSENNKELEENPDIKITFHLLKGSEQKVTLSYVPYDRDFYAVFRNGKSDFIISRNQVRGMLNNLEDLVQESLES